MKTDNFLPIALDFKIDKPTFKRIGLLILTIVVGIFAISVWLSSHLTLTGYYQNQSRSIGQELTRQYQALLSEPLAQNNTTRLTEMLKTLVTDPHVLSASLFDEHGRKLQQQPEGDEFAHFVSLHHNDKLPPHTFVMPLQKNGETLGYIRVLFTQELTKDSMAQLEWVFVSRALLIMLVASLTGIIITRAFYKRRIRKAAKRSV